MEFQASVAHTLVDKNSNIDRHWLIPNNNFEDKLRASASQPNNQLDN